MDSLQQKNLSDTKGTGSEKTKEKLGHRRVTLEGTVTYKKKPTTELQKAIQIGIEFSIKTSEQKPRRDVLLTDFGEIETMDFPREGNSQIANHSLSSDFRFRCFAPNAFRFFRDIYKVNIADFLDSLCGSELRELTNAGASGSVFYISHDDEFIIKTVQHKEASFLQKLLPEYFMNLTQHPRTLLPKYYSLFCYQSLGKNIRLVVMNNLIPSSIRIHEKYDLKGSTFCRMASVEEKARQFPTLKDLDFRELHPNGISLEAETYDALISTIARDCRVLESFRIMDYSLLLGIHNLDQSKRDKIHAAIAATVPAGCVVDAKPEMRAGSKSAASRTTPNHTPARSKSSACESCTVKTSPTELGNTVTTTAAAPFSAQAAWNRSVRRIAAFSTALESIQAEAEPAVIHNEEINNIPPGGIPARNSKGERLLLFVGIIDILQNFRLAKRMEHAFKSVFHDADSISVHNPSFYANRFQNFIGKFVFKRVSCCQSVKLVNEDAQSQNAVMVSKRSTRSEPQSLVN